MVYVGIDEDQLVFCNGIQGVIHQKITFSVFYINKLCKIMRVADIFPFSLIREEEASTRIALFGCSLCASLGEQKLKVIVPKKVPSKNKIGFAYFYHTIQGEE